MEKQCQAASFTEAYIVQLNFQEKRRWFHAFKDTDTWGVVMCKCSLWEQGTFNPYSAEFLNIY